MPWIGELNRNPGMDLLKNESQKVKSHSNEKKFGKWGKN